ncbi:5139_t:CDS:2, partial [Funneliformis caledonium]
IQHEFRRRWKIQALAYYKLEQEKELEKKEVERKYPHDDFMQGYLHQNIENSYTEREIETAKKQVEIESYMLRNKMCYEQEKEIVKYNIQQIAENVAEVLNKTNKSDTSTIDKLDKDRDNTPNCLTSDEKIFSNQVATLVNEVVKFIETPDGTKLKIFSNSSQA